MDPNAFSAVREQAAWECGPQPPSPWLCGLLLGVAKIALRFVGLRQLLRVINPRAGARLSEGVAPALVARIERSVALAASLYPGRALCLEQSLVLYYCLRRRGINATFRIGVQAYPFSAHAWVEYRGHPVNDIGEHVQWFAALPELPI